MGVAAQASKVLGTLAVGTGALAAMVAAPVRAQGDVERLAPSSSWVLDYADDSCALRRTFGGEQQRVWLELRQYAPGDEFLVTAASDAFKALKKKPKSRFEPGGPLREQPLAAFGVYGDGAEGVAFPETLHPEAGGRSSEDTTAWTDELRDGRERSVIGLYLADVFKQELFLETGSLHQPMAGMRACIDDLLNHWGIDPEVDRKLSQRVQTKNMARWARPIQERFPRGLLFVGGVSRVVFRLIVDPAGKLEGCRVMRPVVDQRYEKVICDILFDRAQFEPALDASARPVKSYHLLTIAYVTS